MNAIEKLPIVRALLKILDNEKNLLAGALFGLAFYAAQWQDISAASRGTAMVLLMVFGGLVLAGFSPVDIAAHFGKKYAHETSQAVGKLIDIIEAKTGVDIDDRAETAVQLAVEKELQKLPTNAELAEQFEILKSQIQGMFGMGPTEGQVLSIPKSSTHPTPPDKSAA